MPKPGPRTTYKYTDKFKATAVKLSELPGVRSKDVAGRVPLYTSIYVVALAKTDERGVDRV